MRAGIQRVLGRVWPALAPMLLTAAVAGLATTGSVSTQRTATQMLVNMIVVVGLFVFVGNSGIYSFGHISFVAIGAYVSALVTIPHTLKSTLLPSLPHWLAAAEVSSPVAILVSGFVAGAFGLVVALLIMRLSGVAAGIATLAVLVIVNVVVSNWDAVTRGTQTMIGVPTDTTIGSTLPWTLGVIALAYAYRQSRFGFRLRATREDVVAARAVGINVSLQRSVAFVLSAFVCGLAGSLQAHLLGALSPEDFYIQAAILTLLMLVIGGMSSLSGAVVGTIFVSIVAEALSRIETSLDAPGLAQIALALILLATLLFRPEGLTRGREIGWPLSGRREAGPRPQPPASGPEEEPAAVMTAAAGEG
jgi:branched-chain amino acid transport system permease protein